MIRSFYCLFIVYILIAHTQALHDLSRDQEELTEAFEDTMHAIQNSENVVRGLTEFQVKSIFKYLRTMYFDAVVFEETINDFIHVVLRAAVVVFRKINKLQVAGKIGRWNHRTKKFVPIESAFINSLVIARGFNSALVYMNRRDNMHEKYLDNPSHIFITIWKSAFIGYSNLVLTVKVRSLILLKNIEKFDTFFLEMWNVAVDFVILDDSELLLTEFQRIIEKVSIIDASTGTMLRSLLGTPKLTPWYLNEPE